MASNHPWSLQTYFDNEVGKLTRFCLWTQDARILGCHTLEEPNPTSKNLFLPDTAEKINMLFSGFCVGRVALSIWTRLRVCERDDDTSILQEASGGHSYNLGSGSHLLQECQEHVPASLRRDCGVPQGEPPKLCHSWLKWKRVAAQGPATTTTTMIIDRGRMIRRRQETQGTTTTGVATTMVCYRGDYHHYSLEEEQRLTTMVTITGEKAQGEGCHYDTMTGSTVMATTMQDRLQERFERKRTTTSSDYVIRLTDRLLRLGAKISDCFSQKSPRFSHGSL